VVCEVCVCESLFCVFACVLCMGFVCICVCVVYVYVCVL